MGEYFKQEIKDKYQIQVNIFNTPEDNAITQDVQCASDWYQLKLCLKKDSISSIYLPDMMKVKKELDKKTKEKEDLLSEQ